MTREEAQKLWVHKSVTIRRNGASWTGEVVGYVDEPCMILQRPDGERVPIVIAGATIIASERTERA